MLHAMNRACDASCQEMSPTHPLGRSKAFRLLYILSNQCGSAPCVQNRSYIGLNALNLRNNMPSETADSQPDRWGRIHVGILGGHVVQRSAKNMFRSIVGWYLQA